MSKAKAYTRMILERLHRKGQQEPLKSANSSNQKTQATPSEHRHPPSSPAAFFQDFERIYAVIHEPVRPSLPQKPLRRPLFIQLSQLQSLSRPPTRPLTSNQNMQKRSSKEYQPREILLRQLGQPSKREGRTHTEPYVSPFGWEPKVPGIKVVSQTLGRQNRSVVVRKTQERAPSSCRNPQQALSRYRSLKTLPSVGSEAGKRLERREQPAKYERRQPRRELYHRCESYQRFMVPRS